MISVFLAAIFTVYIFQEQIIPNAARLLNWQDLFPASLATPPSQLFDALPLEAPLGNPPGQNDETIASLAVPDVSGPDAARPSIDKDNKQNQIDDVLERIGALQRQLADALTAQSADHQAHKDKIAVKEPESPKVNAEEKIARQPTELSQQRSIAAPASAIQFYPKILISELQMGSASDSKEEFVELYNPNDSEIDLTDWYVQRKTKTGDSYATFAPHALFSGKIIVAHGYFLIAREGFFAGLADIFIDNPLTEDNTLVLKNPKGDISDKLGWEQAQDYEASAAQNPAAGQSIGRRDQSDTDNNAADFEISSPTPKAENIAYVAPVGPAETNAPIEPTEPIIDVPEEVLGPEHILINEVQIAGQTTKDEFIELYNPNSTAIILDGFSLKKKTSGGNESNLVSSGAFLGVIPALGFFLIAPQNNDDGALNYIGVAEPDLRYSGKTFSIASNNTILLYDKEGALIDKVGFGTAQDFETTAAINPDANQSIERKELGVDTNENSQDFRVSQTPTPRANFVQAIVQNPMVDHPAEPPAESAAQIPVIEPSAGQFAP